VRSGRVLETVGVGGPGAAAIDEHTNRVFVISRGDYSDYPGVCETHVNHVGRVSMLDAGGSR
jgi:hypothetical protein